MARIRTTFALVLLGLSPSVAAETPANELTIFGGQRFGGSFDVRDAAASYDLEDASAFGIIYNRVHETNTHWEVLYTRQETVAENDDPGANDARVDVDLDVLEAGGTYNWGQGRARPYLAMTIGGTRVEARGRAAESDTFLSGSIGLGLRVAPAANIGLRLEARYHAVLTDNDTDLFCRTGPDTNVCAIRLEGRLLGQVTAFAGLSLRF